MAYFRLTSKAVVDLKSIWNFTFENCSEKQADKYYKILIDNFNQISKNPDTGKNYPDIFENIIGLRVGRHIVFYIQNQDNEFLIVRIQPERMELKSRIKEK
jgi:toxin ParE1/3/4